MDERNAEQIIGRHDSQENGTCATVIPLFDAKLEDMKVADFQARFLNAPPLTLQDILHTPDEAKAFKNNLIFTILRIIVKHGGEGFKKFEKDLQKHQPHSDLQIDVHKSDLHPLPAMHIDESTIVGNAEVDEAIVNELHLDKVPEASKYIRFQGGDQLSLARLRALELIRAGQEGGYPGFFWGVWMPGLFHIKIADTHGTFINHWGRPNTGSRNPASLWFHNTRLDRLPVVLTSLPSFRVCRDLIFVSLYARVLHCLLLISGRSSLDDYATNIKDWKTLVAHATQLYEKYASRAVVEELRNARENEVSEAPDGNVENPAQGDKLFEEAALFINDALMSREYSDAIKAGDSGRILLVLKMWALSFRGNGRTKYAFEMLHFTHHVTHVWSKEVCDILFKNWLVNPTGCPDSFVEQDLAQEHLNFWIKRYYKAHGANATWEWLQMIAPTVEVLRHLARTFNDVLGSDQGTRHAPPALDEDIRALMESLNEHKVYTLKNGRQLDEGEEPAKDVVQIGLQHLSQGSKNPINDYNTAFTRLQTRRRMQPVTSDPNPTPTATNNPSTTSDHHIELNLSSGPQVALASSEGLESEGGGDEMLNGEEEVDEPDVMGELTQLLQDIENGVVEPTLPRLTDADVELDMDAVEVPVEDEPETEDEIDDGGDDEDPESEGEVDELEYI